MWKRTRSHAAENGGGPAPEERERCEEGATRRAIERTGRQPQRPRSGATGKALAVAEPEPEPLPGGTAGRKQQKCAVSQKEWGQAIPVSEQQNEGGQAIPVSELQNEGGQAVPVSEQQNEGGQAIPVSDEGRQLAVSEREH